MPFSSYNLLPDLVKAVKAMGFTSFTPIQVRSIPPALEGKDVLGSAMTGSGKTVAFVLPLLQKLISQRAEPRPPSGVRALVLVPTRELAAQVETAVRDLARFTDIRCVLVIGARASTTRPKPCARARRSSWPRRAGSWTTTARGPYG